MIPFEPISDDEPALVHSPMLKAALLTLDYIESNGPIGLTPLKALKRYFVAWAAEAFAWPHYTAAELYDRTFITNAARKISTVGGSLRDVQSLAGHSSLATTQRYIDGDSEARRRVVELV